MRTAIKDLLKQRDISLKEAGAPIGVTRQTVAAWIRGDGGKTIRSRRKMRDFCESLDAQASVLFFDVKELWQGTIPDEEQAGQSDA